MEQDTIIYMTLKFKVKVILISFLYVTLHQVTNL